MSLPAPAENRAAVVTGASSGIGEAIAVELARRGHQLVLVARRTDRLHALAEELESRRRTCCPPTCPAGRARRASGPYRGAGTGTGYLDQQRGLVGRRQVAKSFQNNNLTWSRSMLPPWWTCAADSCREWCERGRGAVLNVSSLAGFYPLPGQAAYGAAKAFVLSYTESLRSELRGSGVTASALCPGPVATGFDDGSRVQRGGACRSVAQLHVEVRRRGRTRRDRRFGRGQGPRRPGPGKSARRGVLSICAT